MALIVHLFLFVFTMACRSIFAIHIIIIQVFAPQEAWGILHVHLKFEAAAGESLHEAYNLGTISLSRIS